MPEFKLHGKVKQWSQIGDDASSIFFDRSLKTRLDERAVVTRKPSRTTSEIITKCVFIFILVLFFEYNLNC